MQAFSNLRRSRFDYQPLILLLLFLAALLYEMVGTIYPFLPPLLGWGFYYWRKHYSFKHKYLALFLFFLYTIFFEIDRELILFSFIFTTLIYHYFIARPLEEYINCDFCLVLFYIFFAYFGYYLINYLLAFIFNLPLPTFHPLYFLYILSDLFLIALVM